MFLFLAGCRETPIGYSIYNKVVSDEPGKLTYVYDTANYKYTFLNGSTIKIALIGIDIPNENNCHKLWRTNGKYYAEENILDRIVKVSFVNGTNVYISYNGQDIGLLLIQEGYAKATSDNHSKQKEYFDAEKTAKTDGTGIYECE